MLFFRLRWFREEREETTDRYVLNLICDSGWLSNLILQKQDHSQSRGMGPISPKLLSVGASSPTVCLSRWLDQSLLSLLEKLLEGFSGLWITCIVTRKWRHVDPWGPLCQSPPSPHGAEAVLSFHPDTWIGNPGKKSPLRTKPNTALARHCL